MYYIIRQNIKYGDALLNLLNNGKPIASIVKAREHAKKSFKQFPMYKYRIVKVVEVLACDCNPKFKAVK
jgi:hypothetical protein